MKLKELADKLGIRLDPPDADAEISSVGSIESALPGQITFAVSSKYLPLANAGKASAVIVDEKFPALEKPTLRTRNPPFAYARAVELLHVLPQEKRGIHPAAVIDPSARIGANASIGACVVIGADVEIGENCTFMPQVVIYRGVKIGKNFFAHSHVSIREHCEIGDNVMLHNGVVIGSDGFGFAKDDSGNWYKIPQTGRVVIEDNVEVQANSCVDRASLGETRIGRNTKIDNLTQVAHNCVIAENSMLCAQVGLAGSTEIGKNVILAGQVGVAGHCKIGDGVIATAQSGIPGDVPAGSMVSGYPAIDNRRWLRSAAVFAKLPEMARAIRGKDKKE
jgi:UDP-3-O-[3-hydroxymyristoyl] glucosamine N-acyltransferase